MAIAAVIGIGLYGRSGGTAIRPNMMLPLAPLALVGLGPAAKVFWLALITGSVLFGGGYMLVPLLEPQVVQSLGWLTREQFLDGIAITQAVPGPIVTLVAFVGYSVAGVAGATLATLGIYIPSFASVFLVAPHMDRWRSMDSVRAALRGVNAVVAGAILGAALRLSPAAIAGAGAVILLLGALIALLRFGIPAVWLVACGLLAGLLRTAL
jgi:chromate transporter